jgi:hypothetical protein
MRWIFVTKIQEVTGGWRKLHNEELHNSNSSPNIIMVVKSRLIKRGETCRTREKDGKRLLNCSRKSVGKKAHRRCKHRMKCNIVMVLEERGCEGVE